MREREVQKERDTAASEKSEVSCEKLGVSVRETCGALVTVIPVGQPVSAAAMSFRARSAGQAGWGGSTSNVREGRRRRRRQGVAPPPANRPRPAHK